MFAITRVRARARARRARIGVADPKKILGTPGFTVSFIEPLYGFGVSLRPFA